MAGGNNQPSTRIHLLSEIRTNRELLEEIRENQARLIADDERRDQVDKWIRAAVCVAVVISVFALLK